MSVEEFQAGTRPSLLVVEVQWEVVACEGEMSFSLTAMLDPGLPVVVSRTWQVMKGRVWDIVGNEDACWGGVLGCGCR